MIIRASIKCLNQNQSRPHPSSYFAKPKREVLHFRVIPLSGEKAPIFLVFQATPITSPRH